MNNFYPLLKTIINNCEAYNIKLILSSEDRLRPKDGLACTGYYDGDVLAVASSKDDWWQTLLHEYCHMKQEMDGKFSDPQPFLDFDDWLNKKIELSEDDLKKSVRLIQKCELDCEKRVIKLVKKHKIIFDYKLYIKKANACLWLYEVARRNRSWCNKKSPAQIEEIFNLCPDKFITSLDNIPAKFEKLFIKYCI